MFSTLHDRIKFTVHGLGGLTDVREASMRVVLDSLKSMSAAMEVVDVYSTSHQCIRQTAWRALDTRIVRGQLFLAFSEFRATQSASSSGASPHPPAVSLHRHRQAPSR